MESYRKFYQHVANTWGPESIPVKAFDLVVRELIYDDVPGFNAMLFNKNYFPQIPGPEFFQIFQYFCGDGAGILEIKIGHHENGKIIELPLKMLSDWLDYREKGNTDHQFFNPETGTRIENFETDVSIWFQATPEFKAMIQEITLLKNREQVLHDLRNDVNKEIMEKWRRLGGHTPYETPLNPFFQYEDHHEKANNTNTEGT